MTTYDDLPGEIWQEIFSHLENTRDLESCSLVSRAWSLLAVELLQEKKVVVLQPSDAASFLLYTKVNQGFAKKIKYLEYECTSVAVQNQEEVAMCFILALLECSHLEQLKVRVFDNISDYVLYLLSAAQDIRGMANPLPRLKEFSLKIS